MLFCKKCGIAENTSENSMVFCHRYKTAINLKTNNRRQDCLYYTPAITEGGEILSPQEHLYLKEAELATTPRRTVNLPNRRRFIAKNFATYSGKDVKGLY